ncbi:MAG: hypothetical protein UX28_C0001G0069 [Candidatus Pacebacteria bacterium GW2011_GWA1_46_10]|nr:MAG: hypothetical protein UX28_C0001G0069 [Candidatus Pacebacteria bacterium GW2011_GWA1_46_10]HCR81707.1 type II toxin-antitoxin system mRNA interferase toxin, RelE/StbE family [Candidatus Paceibacterota bacterium]
MKPITFSSTFQRQLRHLKHNDRQLFSKVKKQLKVFQINPRHPSLRLHKLHGSLKNVWSISVDKNFRLVFISDNQYYFFSMGTHKQVYGK